MGLANVVLKGRYVCLEPLERRHINGLASAAAADTSLYQWSPVPKTSAETATYVEAAIAGQEAGSALPFAIIRLSDGAVVGSTRFFNFDQWAWPEGHPLHRRTTPDGCEIGYTWFTASAIRTAANTESKLLMLTLAFEVWKVFRVCLHTDVRNQRSRAAIERIGGKFEGILRAHRLAADFTPRDSARFSIVASEWPEVKVHLDRLLTSRIGHPDSARTGGIAAGL
jgi:RimJ/RimL family protein N-acetyltransferase